MPKIDDNMQKIFELDPVVVENVTTTGSVVLTQPTDIIPAPNEIDPIQELNKDLDEDYEEGRENLRELIRKGTDAIEILMDIAKESEHPRAFEVIATLIKSTSEVNDKLMMMQKAVREMKGIKVSGSSASGSTNIDKAIFIGSTHDLAKLLKNTKDSPE